MKIVFKNKKIKKSQVLLVGSLLILSGLYFLSYGYFNLLKRDVFEEVRLELSFNNEISEEVYDIVEPNNVVDTPVNNSQSSGESGSTTKPTNTFKYNYIGYLEIPKIGLKRGFLSKDSKYNNIQYNVTVSDVANFPDVENGNFILYAHSGDAYISFFAYLYKLDIGDIAYVTYNGNKYKYKLVKVEVQPKVGVIAIHRPNYNVKGLTLITCTKDSDTEQSIYIFDLV